MFIHVFSYAFIQLHINILKQSRCRKLIPRNVFYQLFKKNSNFIVWKRCNIIYLSFFFFIIIYIYSYVYLCIYSPSYQHFKAFPVSKINSKTSFLYQLFKENSKFIVWKPCKVIFFCLFSQVFICYLLIHTHSNQHFQAFLMSKVNSETSFCINFSRRI